MVPQELKSRTQWLVWRFEKNPKKPEGKALKVPYYADGSRRFGEQGTEEDRRKLTTFDHALEQKTKRGMEGVGFAFLPGDGLIGIDLDGAIDDDGVIKDRAMEIVRACDSYTEFSPSKRGLHVFVLGETKTFKSDLIGVEVYCGAQYFTFTGEALGDVSTAVREISAETLERLRKMVDAAKAKARAKRAADKAPAAQAAEAPKGGDDFKRVNDAAMASLASWVPQLLPAARPYLQGYRVASADLGRDLEEDLSILPNGIVDWGVNDQGDAREGRRTPIDLVMEWGSAKKPAEALHWLAERLGIALEKRKPGRPRSKSSAPAGDGGNAPPSDSGDAPSRDPEDDRPLIRWIQGRLAEIVSKAEDALIMSGQRVFQRDRFLVRVIRRDTPSVRNYERPPGALGLQVVDAAWLTEALTRAARWEKYDTRSAAWRRVNAPDAVAKTYLSRVGQWVVPRLWSVLTAPTLRPDGSVLQEPGYDPAMQAWYDPCGVEFPRIEDKPTREQVDAAWTLLNETFNTVPFDTPRDRAVLLAMVLTGVVRRSLPTAPLGAFTAPVAASGKTLMADAVSIIATGMPAAAMKYPETDEEAQKMAFALLVEGEPVVLIDNVERPLQGDWLCTMLTSETITGRMLGRTETARAPTTCTWMATGNQLVIAGDLRARTLLCRIDPKCERPDQRSFDGDLRVMLQRDRPQLVAAALTVIRGFLTSGRTVGSGPDAVCPTFGRFERWSEWVRGAVVWLGLPDPCDSRAEIESNDPELAELRRMLATWWGMFGSDAKTAKEFVDQATPTASVGLTELGKVAKEILDEIAKARDGTLSSRRLAKWLHKFAGRRVDGMHFERDGETDHVALWKVERAVAKTDGGSTG